MSHTCLSVHTALIRFLPERVQSHPWDYAVPPRFLVTSSPPRSCPTEYSASHVAGSCTVHSCLDISALSPRFGPLSLVPLAHTWPLQTLLSEPPRWPASWSVVWHAGRGAGCVEGWLACSEGVLWGSLQARLGSQGDAQAMQAVRTARGNSFCVDCDAPSKRCYPGRGAHPRGEGAPATPGTPSVSPERAALCLCPLLSCSGLAPWGWGAEPPASLACDPSLASLRSWPLRAHLSQGH